MPHAEVCFDRALVLYFVMDYVLQFGEMSQERVHYYCSRYIVLTQYMLAQAILVQHTGPNDPYSVHAHPVVTQSTRYLTGYFKSYKISISFNFVAQPLLNTW